MRVRFQADADLNQIILLATIRREPAVDFQTAMTAGLPGVADPNVLARSFENLEDDASVSEFVEWFPGVTLEQVRAVLEHAARSALAPA